MDCIISIIEENPESKETGLAHLCEFIEDCEHTVLATKILHLLGKEGPRTPQPSKYIRFIFNRVVLESEAVRAGETEWDLFMYHSIESSVNSLISSQRFISTLAIFMPFYNKFLLPPPAAVSALAKFGAQNDDLLPSVLVLMQRYSFTFPSLFSLHFIFLCKIQRNHWLNYW